MALTPAITGKAIVARNERSMDRQGMLQGWRARNWVLRSHMVELKRKATIGHREYKKGGARA